MYTVTFTSTENIETISQVCETKRKASTWAKWLTTQKWAKNVKVRNDI